MKKFFPLMHLQLVLPVLLGGTHYLLPAQQVVSDFDQIPELLESLSLDAESSADDSAFPLESLSGSLERYLENPLNLNIANEEQLAELGLLSTIQLAAVINHRVQYGDLLSVYELQSVRSFETGDIERLIPFITVGSAAERSRAPWTQQLFGGTRQLILRYSSVIEDPEGYTRPDSLRGYLGNRASIQVRYRYNFGNRISYGFTAEKDPGEAWFGSYQPRGFDFYSAHFYTRDLGRLRDLCVGDYELRIGQGLVWWSGFGFRKSATPMEVQKTGRPLGPYSSINENRFLRGAAARLRMGPVELTLFGSYKSLDANPTESGDSVNTTPETITAFIDDGLHRTENELQKKDVTKETIAGANFSFQYRKVRVGLMASHIRYNLALNLADLPYNRYSFSDNNLSNASLHYSGNWHNISFFGETALSGNGSFALLNGMLASLHPRMDLSVVHRHFDKAYHALYAAPFGEQIVGRNERGLYLGIALRPARAFTLNAYADIYSHPWLRFSADGPSRGRDYLVQLGWSPSRNTLLYLRARHEIKEENAPDNETELDILTDFRRTSLRINLSAKLSPEIKVQSRVEGVWTDHGNQTPESGLLIFQDIQWSPERLPFVLTARYALFDAESFDARIYSFENDVLYAFSIPFFSDRGSRYYLLARFKISRWLDVYTRFARTGYSNRESTGTDLDLIEEPHRSEIKILLRLKW